MTNQFLAPLSLSDRYRLSTEQFAAQHLVQPQTVRKSYSENGSYHGVRPVRLPNRRLLWPADSISRIACEQGISAEGVRNA